MHANDALRLGGLFVVIWEAEDGNVEGNIYGNACVCGYMCVYLCFMAVYLYVLVCNGMPLLYVYAYTPTHAPANKRADFDSVVGQSNHEWGSGRMARKCSTYTHTHLHICIQIHNLFVHVRRNLRRGPRVHVHNFICLQWNQRMWMPSLIYIYYICMYMCMYVLSCANLHWLPFVRAFVLFRFCCLFCNYAIFVEINLMACAEMFAFTLRPHTHTHTHSNI